MRNLKRKISKKLINKRHLRADVLSLLSSALRPRLLGNRGGFGLNVTKIVALSTILGSFSFIAILFSTPVSAASLTLTLPSDPLTLNFDSSSNETFKESSSATVSAKTSGINYGYTLSIKAKDGNTLKNDKNNTLNSISSSLSASNFANQSQSNIWGYQPSKFNSSNNSNYLAGPTTTSSTIDKTSSSGNSTTSYSFKIAAKIDPSSAVGKYSNTFILTLTANSVSYKITYNLNSGSWTETSPQSGDTIESSVKISSVAPTRSNYEFLGWCSVSTSADTCDSITYQPGETIDLSSDNDEIQLWARWKTSLPAAVNKGSLGTMQSFNCNSKLPDIHNYGTVTDSRDNSQYRVAKLMDGKCWMVQNLRIIGKTISSSDSDITSGSFTIYNTGMSSFRTTSSNTNNKEAYYGDNTEYGAYYTWSTATTGSGDSITEEDQNAPDSICPKGWKLPTTSETNADTDIQKLFSFYSGTDLLTSPVPDFVFSGMIMHTTGAASSEGMSGTYWSSTVSNKSVAFTLLVGRYPSPASVSYRQHGYPVRCIAK